MTPTDNYLTFQLARSSGCSAVAVYLGGMPPVSAMERHLWTYFELATQRLQKQQGKH